MAEFVAGRVRASQTTRGLVLRRAWWSHGVPALRVGSWVLLGATVLGAVHHPTLFVVGALLVTPLQMIAAALDARRRAGGRALRTLGRKLVIELSEADGGYRGGVRARPKVELDGKEFDEPITDVVVTRREDHHGNTTGYSIYLVGTASVIEVTTTGDDVAARALRAELRKALGLTELGGRPATEYPPLAAGCWMSFFFVAQLGVVLWLSLRAVFAAPEGVAERLRLFGLHAVALAVLELVTMLLLARMLRAGTAEWVQLRFFRSTPSGEQ